MKCVLIALLLMAQPVMAGEIVLTHPVHVENIHDGELGTNDLMYRPGEDCSSSEIQEIKKRLDALEKKTNWIPENTPNGHLPLIEYPFTYTPTEAK